MKDPGQGQGPGPNEPRGKTGEFSLGVPSQEGQGGEGKKVQQEIGRFRDGYDFKGKANEETLEGSGDLDVERDVGSVIRPRTSRKVF